MPTRPDYSSKAESFARYRWDYAPEAVATIAEISGIKPESTIADIGAGTGKFSRNFLGRVKRVFAVEPDPAMRRQAELVFQNCPDCVILDGTAENIPLPDESIDLITVAQAIHWFDPVPTRREFYRILKPSGWLAIVRNYGTDPELNQACDHLFSLWRTNEDENLDFSFENGLPFYFNGVDFQRLVFPFSFRQPWLAFLGALTATTGMPDESTIDFPAFSKAAEEVFKKHSERGWMTVVGETEVHIGRPVRDPV
jgi:SAM-dependent methyltransferase